MILWKFCKFIFLTESRRIMSIFYIRHGDDDSGGRQEYRQDPRLSKSGYDDIIRFTRKMIKKYGTPDIIFVSPMYRAVETYEQMKKIPELNEVPMKISPKISRYFTRKERNLDEISPETLARKVPVYETVDEFHHRIDKFDRKSRKWMKRGAMVWCITHCLVMKRIAENHKRNINEHIEFLDYFTI